MADLQRERLRQASVAGIIEATGLESQVEEREAQQRTVPIEFEGRTYDIPLRSIGQYLGGLQQRMATEAYREAQREERAGVRAERREEREEARAEGRAERETARQLAREERETARMLAREERAATRAETAQERAIDNARQAEALKLQASKDRRSEMQALAEAEGKIAGTDPKFTQAAQPFMDFFNSQSEADYVWMNFAEVPKTGILGLGGRAAAAEYGGQVGGANTRIPIPPMANGQRVSAREVYEAASSPDNPGGPMTVKEYMEKIYFPRKVGKKAPWLPQ